MTCLRRTNPLEGIRAQRLERGLFQKDVARLVGVCTDTVTNWEKSRSSPDLRTFPRVLEFLGYDPHDQASSAGEAVRHERERRGLSLPRAAAQLSVDPGSLRKWELAGNRQSHCSMP